MLSAVPIISGAEVPEQRPIVGERAGLKIQVVRCSDNLSPRGTTPEKTLHMNITKWSTPKSDSLYSLQPKMEKLYTVRKNKTRSWL